MHATVTTFWQYWKRFGHAFGMLQTHLILALSYFLIFGLGRLTIAIRKADPLAKRFPDPSPSLYAAKEPSPTEMAAYLKQF